jgi:hypothetical protein
LVAVADWRKTYCTRVAEAEERGYVRAGRRALPMLRKYKVPHIDPSEGLPRRAMARHEWYESNVYVPWWFHYVDDAVAILRREWNTYHCICRGHMLRFIVGAGPALEARCVVAHRLVAETRVAQILADAYGNAKQVQAQAAADRRKRSVLQAAAAVAVVP